MAKFSRPEGHKAPDAMTGDFPPLAPGWYQATIYEAAHVDFSKKPEYAGKNEGLNIQYKIAPGQEGAGRTFFSRVYTGDVKFPSGKKSDNFGLFDLGDAVTNGQFRKDYDEGEANLPERADLLGVPVEIRLRTTTYNGEERSEVANVRAPGSGAKAKANKKSKPANLSEELDL